MGGQQGQVLLPGGPAEQGRAALALAVLQGLGQAAAPALGQ